MESKKETAKYKLALLAFALMLTACLAIQPTEVDANSLETIETVKF